MMGGPRRRGAPMPRMSIKGQGHILKRLMKIVFENYLWQFIAVIVCIVVTLSLIHISEPTRPY